MENCNRTSARECGCNNTLSRPMPACSMPARPTPACSMPARPMPHSCNRKNDPLANMPLAMAYVPWQFFQDVYEPDKALQYGTIFPELNKPFYGRGGCPR